MHKQHLIDEYNKKKSIIAKRLKEFARPKSDKSLFVELCFCLCTPQSNAKRVASVINEDNYEKLFNADIDEIKDILRSNARFHNNKAKYIVAARDFFQEIKKLPKHTGNAREYLVKNIKGLGLKESSHFLRNIGYRDLCIIDRHVVNVMHDLNVFKNKKMPANQKEYFKMEKKLKDFAKSINIDVDELDLLMWSLRTGFVFK